MESAVEQRLNVLEARVKTLESLLGLDAPPLPAPAAPPRPSPPASQMWPEPRAAARAQAPSRDLEEILGGRVLGWVGGVAVTVAAIFGKPSSAGWKSIFSTEKRRPVASSLP